MGAVQILAEHEVIIILTVIINVRFLPLVVIVVASWCQLTQLQVVAHSIGPGCEGL